jgi:hypothetical protein
MEERKISEEEAKEVCREKIKVTIIDFRKIVEDAKAREEVSLDTKRYLEGLLYSLSGNLVWSIDCPRYHRWSSYNERQLDWMKNGIPKSSKNPPKANGITTVNGKGLHNGVEKTIANGNMKGNRAVHTPVLKGSRNGAGHGLVSNGSTGLEDLFSLEVDTDLVNVFARKEYKAVNGLKLHEGEKYPTISQVELNGDVASREDSEIETKVSTELELKRKPVNKAV